MDNGKSMEANNNKDIRNSRVTINSRDASKSRDAKNVENIGLNFLLQIYKVPCGAYFFTVHRPKTEQGENFFCSIEI